MHLGEILFYPKQESDGCWCIYYGNTGNRVIECGRWATEEQAKQAAIDFFDA
jgi:hypothetical protein